MTAIDPSWSRFGSEEFSTSKSKNTLFGEKFQSKLTSMVEKDTALAKAVSITKRHKKDSAHQKGRASNCPFFFQKGPPGKTGRARILSRTHSMQARTGIQSEGPTCSTVKPITNNTTDQGRNHYSTSHASQHHRHLNSCRATLSRHTGCAARLRAAASLNHS